MSRDKVKERKGRMKGTEMWEYGQLLEEEKSVGKEATFEIVSRVAYLIGVEKCVFENEYEPPKMEIFQMMEKERTARIIRNLCMLRTAIQRRYIKIKKAMKFEYKGLLGMPELIPQQSIRQLEEDGVHLIKSARFGL